MKNAEIITGNIVKDLGLKVNSVASTVSLLEGGATIPFIARYRKEKTGSLDETAIRSISEKFEYYTELEARKDTVLKTIEKEGKLTTELREKIEKCTDKNRLEDLYLPYKPKKRTRATIAIEKGLLTLADMIYAQENIRGTKNEIMARFVNPEKGVNSHEEALAGAIDIVAEKISDDGYLRGWIRDKVNYRGVLVSKAKKEWSEKKSKYENYYMHTELIRNAPSHRILAIRRGAEERVLSWKIDVDEDEIISFMESRIIKREDFMFSAEMKTAAKESFERLIFPSVEKEVFSNKAEEAEKDASAVFSRNLSNLLLAPPAGSRTIIGIDPGYRTGCKVAVIDSKGDFREYKAIYPHEPANRIDESEKILIELIKKYDAELIAIGNGTASKETDVFVRDVLRKNCLKAKSIVVSEAGASVYSASETAAKEFPELDVTVRGAISIARRLQDPLAELVKIDPKSIGVGQYQHDINPAELKKTLHLTVEHCVNYVGVELNTASVELLSYVSGIGRSLAENIVQYRTENSFFMSRNDLRKVPKFGPKAFEQSAGFLRIRSSSNPLDNSAIHPEAYHVVEKIADDEKVSVGTMIGNDSLIGLIDIRKYVTDDFGIPTLTDMMNELQKPGLDPRKEFKSIEFSQEINTIDDLKEGMLLDGVVTNVANFGAFVDIGVHQDGLIHISKLAKKFVRNPHEIVSVGDAVKVKVVNVDGALKRISLERIVE